MMCAIRWLTLAALALPACAGQSPEPGTEEGRCRPDGSCSEGLSCLSNTCVRLPEALDAGGDRSIAALDGRGSADRQLLDVGPDTTPQAPLQWASCDTSSWPSGYPKPAPGVECTTVQVPLDHDAPGGTQLELRVARHRAKTASPTGKAVFQLAGGPGGSAVAQSGLIPLYLPKLREHFDLVYVDQRGTGGSDYMNCPGGYPQTQAGWASCAASHAGKDLDHYLSVDAAHDLETVRRRMGYGKIYLRGGSYGTRVGLEMMRQHPDSLAAVVLDGLDPPDSDFFSTTIRKMDRGVTRLIADCGLDGTCQAVAPDLEGDLRQRRATLKATPRKILVNGQPYFEDEETFLLDLKSFVEDSYWRFRVPRAVHAAVSGDNKLWNGLMSEIWGATISDAASLPLPKPARPLRLADRPRRRLPFTRGLSYVAPGLYMAVLCAESLPNAPDLTALQTLVAQQDWGALTAGALTDIAAACASWKVGPLAESLRQPVTSPVKTLLLSGAIDFVTPAEAGDQAVKHLAAGTHLVVPHATHSTMSVPCVGGIIASFFEADGELSAVDTSCLASLPAPKW